MQKKSEIVISENCIDLRIDDWANGEDNYFSENDKLESVVAKLAYESAKPAICFLVKPNCLKRLKS